MIRSLPSPSWILLIIFFLVLTLPALAISSMQHFEFLRTDASTREYGRAADLYALHTVLFFSILVLSYLFSAGALYGTILRPFCTWPKAPRIVAGGSKNRPLLLGTGGVEIAYLSRVMVYTCVISSIFIMFFFATGGYKKLSLLSSGLTMLEFRLAGSFDDANRYAKALLQVARRLLLPFALVYLTLLCSAQGRRSMSLAAFWAVYLLGIVSTLDRAPILMTLVMLMFFRLVRAEHPWGWLLKRLPFLLGFIIATAGIMTFIQVNMLDFGLAEAIDNGVYFLWHRVGAAPAIAAIELSYIPLPPEADRLWLQFSRLGALFGGTYVGTDFTNSIYVAPVGIVGDLWRNIGLGGIVVAPIILGVFMATLDRGWRRMELFAQAALSFTTITLAFYLSNGVLFSQGVFIQVVFMLVAIWLFRKRLVAGGALEPNRSASPVGLAAGAP